MCTRQTMSEIGSCSVALEKKSASQRALEEQTQFYSSLKILPIKPQASDHTLC